MVQYFGDNRGSLVVLICFSGQLAFAGYLVCQNVSRSFQTTSSSAKAKTTNLPNVKQVELESSEYSISSSTESNATSLPYAKQRELGSSEYSIPQGYALFFSSRDQSLQKYKIEINSRKNANGDIVYDVSWSDGVETVFVFWKNGDAEIITKQQNKAPIVDKGSYRFDSQGQLVVTSSSGSHSVFPDLIPAAN